VPDQLVTVATYTLPYEAELAKNLLEAEGIRALVGGDLSGGLLASFQVQLQVPEEDAPRASAILAAQAAAALDEDWEDRAEAGVWTCSLCGEPVPEEQSVCRSCRTPRDAIRANRPPSLLQTDAPSPPSDAIQARDQVRATVPPPSAPLPSVEVEPDEGPSEPEPPSAAGDDLARRAFIAAVFGFVVGSGAWLIGGLTFHLVIDIPSLLLLMLSWWYLARVFLFPGDLRPAGMRYLYGALAVNGIVFFYWAVIGLMVIGAL
jgi:hypothetical protein